MDQYHPDSMDSRISEILAEIKAIKQKGDNRQELLCDIRDQVTKTNGRVTYLEAQVATSKWWITAITGVILAIVAILEYRK